MWISCLTLETRHIKFLMLIITLLILTVLSFLVRNLFRMAFCFIKMLKLVWSHISTAVIISNLYTWSMFFKHLSSSACWNTLTAWKSFSYRYSSRLGDLLRYSNQNVLENLLVLWTLWTNLDFLFIATV